jgi:hypothetical protein
MAGIKRSQALELADALLTEIELARLSPMDIVRKASRFARLLDDEEALKWLQFEISGFSREGEGLNREAFEAGRRSNRIIRNREGQERCITTSLGELQAEIDASLAQIQAASDPDVSITSANPNQYVTAPAGNRAERYSARQAATRQRGILDKILGAIHQYVSARYYELRFGSAIETAFEVVRDTVDSSIARLVPDAPKMLSAAFENAASRNPEHWATAATSCRRLLKTAADSLRPPGENVAGRRMGEEQYINRLINWIETDAGSPTRADLVVADLEYLGRRLDAVQESGSKGTHASVDRFEASRLVTGTYLLLGDILQIIKGKRASHEEAAELSEGEGPSGRQT